MVVRDMIEFSILVGLLDDKAPPPLATTNDEEDEALFPALPAANESEYCCCPLLPVLMKNKALNAIANVTNFCLNRSLLLLLLLVCRVVRDDDILFEILVIVDRTFPRMFDDNMLFLMPLLSILLLDMNNCCASLCNECE